jgi:hypothetical protein
MPIEKAFAIRSSANDIYSALQRDIASASAHEGDVFEVVRRERDRLVELRVTIGGIPGILTYMITETPDHAEVSASFEPQGWRWVMFNLATLGLRRNSIEMVLVQGLANLKEDVENQGQAKEQRIEEYPLSLDD